MVAKITEFSDSTLSVLDNGERRFYVYCLTDLKKDKVLYIGTGSGNRIFETGHYDAPTAKALSKCKKLGRFIISNHLTEDEARAAETALATFVRTVLGKKLKSHRTEPEGGVSVEELERRFGFAPVHPAELNPDGVIMAVKVPHAAVLLQNGKDLADAALGGRQIGKGTAAKIKYIAVIDTELENAAVTAFEIDGFETYPETRNGKPLTLYRFHASESGKAVLSKLGLEQKCLPELKFAVASDKAYIRPHEQE